MQLNVIHILLLSGRAAAFLDHLKEASPMGTPDELASYISSFVFA